jgi:hypothetical protein
VLEERADVVYHNMQRRMKRAVDAVGIKASGDMGGDVRAFSVERLREWVEDASQRPRRRPPRYLRSFARVNDVGDTATMGRFSRT